MPFPADWVSYLPLGKIFLNSWKRIFFYFQNDRLSAYIAVSLFSGPHSQWVKGHYFPNLRLNFPSEKTMSKSEMYAVCSVRILPISSKLLMPNIFFTISQSLIYMKMSYKNLNCCSQLFRVTIANRIFQRPPFLFTGNVIL